VQKAADKGGVETKQSSAATVLMAQFTKELGVPSSIIARMVATPPTQVVWLDQRDLHSMGVRTLGVSVQPAQIARETVIVVQKPAADAAAMIVPAKQAADRPPWNEFIERTTALAAFFRLPRSAARSWPSPRPISINKGSRPGACRVGGAKITVASNPLRVPGAIRILPGKRQGACGAIQVTNNRRRAGGICVEEARV
jgi:hypothetical protein